MQSIEEKQRIEIDYWRISSHEGPDSDSVENIVNKVSDAEVFLHCLKKYEGLFVHSQRVLEMGGGQGWASCLMKRLYPHFHVTMTDISEYAVRSLKKWEHIWNVEIDSAYACKSFETKEVDQSLDFVFCFASAHHFLEHERTLLEIKRILKPGGIAIYWHEPSCNRLFYSMAYKRVNKNRPWVPEDLLITDQMLSIAQRVGIEASVDYYPSLIRRRPKELIYYQILSRVKILQKFFPCTANFIFRK